MSLRVWTIALFVFLLFTAIWWVSAYQSDNYVYPETRKIRKTADTFERQQLYTLLIKRVGTVKAQEALYRSGLPFDGETHLLNHESGVAAYDTYGRSGILYCKDYFLGSCYHGFIITLISREGLKGIAEIEECWNASFARRIQCAHAVGHGLLAFVGYKNLPEALSLCADIGKNTPRFPLFNCGDGVFMENLWGVHDGEPSSERWIVQDDSLFPCDDLRIKEEWRLSCFANQASVMYQLFSADIEKISETCGSLANKRYEIQCFEGLARQIHPIAKDSAERVFDLCGRVGARWNNFCILTVAVTDYAFGGKELPRVLCEALSGEDKKKCFFELEQMQ